MRMSTITVPFHYGLEFVPLRGSAVRSVKVADSIDVEVPDVSREDAPIRIQAHTHIARYDRRLFEGNLYGSLNTKTVLMEIPIRNMPPAWGGEVSESFDGEAMAMSTLFQGDSPACIDPGRARPVERPLGISRVVQDGRDACVEAIRAAAGSLLLVNGRLFRKSPAPVRALTKWDQILLINDLVQDASRCEGYVLGLDRGETMDQVVDRVRARGSFSIEPRNVVIERFDWDVSSVPEAGPNAAQGAIACLWQIGKDIGSLPPEVVSLAAEISRLRRDTPEGAFPDPTEAHRLLSSVIDATPRDKYLLLRRNVEMALDFIAASRDFHAVPLDEVDVEALGEVVFGR